MGTKAMNRYRPEAAVPVTYWRKWRALVDRSSIGRVVVDAHGRYGMITGVYRDEIELCGRFMSVDRCDQLGIRFEDGSRLFEELKNDRHE